MTDKVGQLTDYKAIADRLVELGIIHKHSKEGYLVGDHYNVRPRTLCHDWRVAGACMADAVKQGYRIVHFDDGDIGFYDAGPLAIILAYLEATDD